MTANGSATHGGGLSGTEAAEHERQFRELLEFCPAALLIVDEDGRLLFHNARLRESWDTARKSWTSATPASIGTTSISARALSRSCGTAADNC
jgi:hypothetical protein